jgi:signal peptidase II
VNADGPAWRSPRAWAVLLCVWALTLTADLWSKHAAFATVAGDPIILAPREVVADPAYRLPWHSGVQVLSPDLLDFHLVVNHGAVFGIGQDARGMFIVLTVVAVSVGLVLFAFWTRARSTVSHIALGLVLAGGIGNLYDRITFGAVRDFLHMLPRRDLPFQLSWPGGSREIFPWVFNIADVVLLVGMAILILQSIRADAAARTAGKTARSTAAQP